MKLWVPIVGKPEPVDERLIRLANSIGIETEWLQLQQGGLPPALPIADASIAVNPSVWSRIAAPTAAADWLRASGAQLLVYAVHPQPYASELIKSMSSGHISGVTGMPDPSLGYTVASQSGEVCGPYAGVAFAPANSASDCVLTLSGRSAARPLISAGGGPLFAELAADKSRMFFIASAEVTDLNAQAGDRWATEFFSGLIPYVMALRAIFGDSCWKPVAQHAAIVVDDPLLRPRYGFLDFEQLLRMAREHNFHAVLAFIPYNFSRIADSTVQIFRENRDHLSLCFHGNDHTAAEFASPAASLLHTILQTAERRIEKLTASTGLICDRVMVFPQGRFSDEAMSALRDRNFDAAVNTVTRPYGTAVDLSIGELTLPAIVRYGGFPLFLRRSSVNTQMPETAFCLFFGRPVFIVEHHDRFERPQPLLDAVHRINSLAPGIKWSPLSTATAGAQLSRTRPDGSLEIRAWARTAHVTHSAPGLQRCVVEWPLPEADSTVIQVVRDGLDPVAFMADSTAVRVSLDLAAGETARLSVVHRNAVMPHVARSLRYSARVFIRRRMSETRDNLLSRNPTILNAAKSVQRRLRIK